MKIKSATTKNLDDLYANEAAAFEVSFERLTDDQNFYNKFLHKLKSAGLKLKEDTTIYIVNGETLNKHYNLEGDNSYSATFKMSLIPYDDLEFLIDPLNTDDMEQLKLQLGIRWFKDVVDNNEYREYIKGRHEASEQIQWLIDLMGER